MSKARHRILWKYLQKKLTEKWGQKNNSFIEDVLGLSE